MADQENEALLAKKKPSYEQYKPGKPFISTLEHSREEPKMLFRNLKSLRKKDKVPQQCKHSNEGQVVENQNS